MQDRASDSSLLPRKLQCPPVFPASQKLIIDHPQTPFSDPPEPTILVTTIALLPTVHLSRATLQNPGSLTILNGRLRHLFSTPSSSGWTPLGRGSDGRFGLRRFRAKLTPTPFGTHRAFTHALPPSFGLRSVPFTVPPCFFPLPLK